MDYNQLSGAVIEAAIDVHKALGPGLLESVYESALAYELELREIRVKRQVPIGVRYKTLDLEEAFKADLVINDSIIIELKSVEKLQAVHKKQLLTYLRLSNTRLGLLINFGHETLRQGITRLVNDFDEPTRRPQRALRDT